MSTKNTAKAVKLTIATDASAATIEKLIKSIGGRGAKLDADIHSAACASLNHAGLHNDPTLLNRLLCALPKTARRNALVVWALKFGNLLLNDGKNKDTMPLVYNKAGKLDLANAIATPFWEFKNVREGATAWVYVDYMANVVKTLEKHAADPTNPEATKAKAALAAILLVNAAPIAPAASSAPALV